MKRRIAIYGGTDLSAAESWFVVSLTYALLQKPGVIIITGGFLFSKKYPGAISTDFSVLQGALKYCSEKKIHLNECLETWLPDEIAEDDPQKKDVERFKEGKVIKLTGKSAYARRFSMVRDVDALITVKGEKHTAIVLEFASSIKKPALPLVFTGGDSRSFWNIHKNQIKEWLDLPEGFVTELEMERIELLAPSAKEEMIKTIVELLQKAIEKELKNSEACKQTENVWELRDNIQNNQFELEGAPSKKLSLFLSYSHKDEELRAELDKHLTALKRSNKISVWYDKEIEGGQWDDDIKKELQDADIILLLVSPDFMASNYIWDVELAYALNKGKCKVIPIFLRSVDINDTPISTLQGYISKDKPITSFEKREQDGAFYQVVSGIRQDIRNWPGR